MEQFIQNIWVYLGQNIVPIGTKILLVLALWIIGTIIINNLNRFIKKAISKYDFDKTSSSFLASMASVLMKVILLIAIAQTIGVEATSLTAALAAASFAIGMALQGSLGNFAGGVMLLLFKPFKVGDLISAQGFTGVVDEIQIFNTLLLTPDNKKVIIPNGGLSNGVITNISGQDTIRVDMTFGIGYGDDINQARKVIQAVCDKSVLILKDKPVDIFVSELADSSVNFAVRPWAESKHYWDVYFYCHEEIKKAFDAENIGIPYQTLDVNIVK